MRLSAPLDGPADRLIPECDTKKITAKIRVTIPVVELDGDEMTRIIWGFIKARAFSVALGRIAADTLAGLGRY